MEIRGKEGMEHEAARFIASLSPHADMATIVTLGGDLGAGKTTFVQGVAKALDVSEHVTSPTFVIMKIYDLEHTKFDRLVHIDAYRLKGAHHLSVLGWEELIRDPKNIMCIEWPEQAAGAIPEHALAITLRYTGEETREITYGKNFKT